METILTVNGGSSSLKCGLYSTNRGELTCLYHLKFGNLLGDEVRFDVKDETNLQVLAHTKLDFSAIDPEQRHQAALEHVLQWLNKHLDNSELIATGHRIVHGGSRYAAPIQINDDAMEHLRHYIPLAPLHQPYNLRLVEACRSLAPELPLIGCFDTMFHTTQPAIERLYAIPRHLSEAGVKRYGFHGISYEYIHHCLQQLGSGELKTVVCHLGAGASMCAIADGHSIATSMGFTAVDGLPMGSRCGNLDPGVLLYLMRQYQMDADAIEHMLYKESGWLGVSGISSDMITLHQSDKPEAEEAIELFSYRIAMEMGRLSAALGGLEQIVFTGGVGENDADVRKRVIARCNWLGAEIDAEANSRNAALISSTASRQPIHVIPTNEELMIAMRVNEILHPDHLR